MSHEGDQAALGERLAAVRARIDRAAQEAGREPDAVTLVAVSKTMPPERVASAYAAGVRHFGENRVQEGESKAAALSLPDATWHLIGHLQTNKARGAARAFGLIHSVDSRRVAEALSSEAARLGRDVDVLLEVNVAGEATKFGFDLAGAESEAPLISSLPGLRLIGLMTIAPHVDDAETIRPVFRDLRRLGERLRSRVGDPSSWHLSMGMTNDFPVAIAEGATIVRIGRAIFGDRTTP